MSMQMSQQLALGSQCTHVLCMSASMGRAWRSRMQTSELLAELAQTVRTFDLISFIARSHGRCVVIALPAADP